MNGIPDFFFLFLFGFRRKSQIVLSDFQRRLLILLVRQSFKTILYVVVITFGVV